MTSIHPPDAAAPEHAPRIDTFCFAAWHWHFYAGLFVMPFLRVLAITGGIMMIYAKQAPNCARPRR